MFFASSAGVNSGEAAAFVDESADMFLDLAMDDTLDTLSRVEQYIGSEYPLQRLVLARDIVDAAREAGFSATRDRLLPLLEDFALDNEPSIRNTYAEQLVPLSSLLLEIGRNDGYKYVLETIVPHLFLLVGDKNDEVSSAAVESLTTVCELLQPDDLSDVVLYNVGKLSGSEQPEEKRVVAAELLCRLSVHFGPEKCNVEILPFIAALADDSSFSVRKSVALHVGLLASSCGAELTQNELFPVYAALCGDEIWGVRKACCESLVPISLACSPEFRREHLIALYDKFSSDVSRWVRSAALRHVGQFITTINPKDVSDSLLQSFAHLAFPPELGSGNRTRPNYSSTAFDADLSEHCAFSFPGVLLTIGAERFDGEIRDAYVQLTKDLQWKVRRTLALSLHEVARILGSEKCKSDLLPVLDVFLEDLDEVKIGVVRNLTLFFSQVSSEVVRSYFPKISEMLKHTENWRIRLYIAEQLGSLTRLARNTHSPSVSAEVEGLGLSNERNQSQPETIPEEEVDEDSDDPSSTDALVQNVVSMLQRLIDDPYAAVREKAAASAGEILSVLLELGTEESLVDIALKLAQSEKAFQRQLFIDVCVSFSQFVGFAYIRSSGFWDILLQLADDPVPNVRIALCKALKSVYLGGESCPRNETFIHDVRKDSSVYLDEMEVQREAVLRKLAFDADVDVVYFAGGDSSVCVRKHLRKTLSGSQVADKVYSSKDSEVPLSDSLPTGDGAGNESPAMNTQAFSDGEDEEEVEESTNEAADVQEVMQEPSIE